MMIVPRALPGAAPDPSGDLGPWFAASTISGWDVAIAILVVIVGWIVSIFAKRGVLTLMVRLRGISPDLASLVARLVKYAVLLVAVGVALGFLGASVQPLLTATIIAGIVIVLALRGIADNFAAGVVLQTRRPIKVGDEIQVGDYIGSVRELNGRAVVIRTLDGRTVHVPNQLLLQSPVVNHSEAGARRSTVQVRVALGSVPTDEVMRMLHDATQSAEGVHSREPTHVSTVALSPNRATFTVDFWHHPANARTVSSNVVRALGAATTEHNLAAVIQSDLPAPPLTPPEEL